MSWLDPKPLNPQGLPYVKPNGFRQPGRALRRRHVNMAENLCIPVWVSIGTNFKGPRQI